MRRHCFFCSVGIGIAALVLSCALPLGALQSTETRYLDPASAFTVTVPAHWQTQRNPGSPMVTFANRESQSAASVGVFSENAATPPHHSAAIGEDRSQPSQALPPGQNPEARPFYPGRYKWRFPSGELRYQQRWSRSDEVRRGD